MSTLRARLPGRGLDRRILGLLGAMSFGTGAYAALSILVGLQVYDLSRRELYLGFIGMVQFAPSLLLLFVTGSVADRFDRARVCAISMGGQGLVAGLLAAYAWTRPTAVEPVFLIVATLGVARSFLTAAMGPLPADIVEPDRLPWLVARRALASRAGSIVGPVVGGALYVVDPALAFGAMATLSAAAAVLFWTVQKGSRTTRAPRPAGTAKVRSLTDGLEGIRVIRATPILAGAISLDLFVVLFGGAIALLPAIAEDRLGVDAVGLGMLRAAGGVGGAIVFIALALRPIERRVGRALLLAVGVFGVATVVLGSTDSFPVALVAVAIVSGSDAISVFIRANVVPLASPPNARGRVAAVENLFIGASNELGAFESGVTGEILGSAGAVILGGVATLAVGAAYAARVPALRGLDRYVNASAIPASALDLTPRAVEPDA